MGHKLRRTFAVVLVAILLFPGCFGTNNSPSDDSEDLPVDPPVDPPALPCDDGFNQFGSEELFAYEGFEEVLDDDPQNTIFKRWEGGHNDSYHIVTEDSRTGEKSFRVDITPNETTQGGPDRAVKIVWSLALTLGISNVMKFGMVGRS